MKDTSMYAPVHAGVWKHWKLRRFARALGLNQEAAIGIFLRVAHLALEQAADGCFHGWPHGEVDMSIDLSDEIKAALGGRSVVAAMLEAGWMTTNDEGSLVMHDWDLYTGLGLQRRAAERAKSAARSAKSRAVRKGVAVRDDSAIVTKRDAQIVTPDMRTIDRDETRVAESDGRNGNGNWNGNGNGNGGDSAEAASRTLALSEREPHQEPIPKPRPKRLMGAGVMGMASDAMWPKTEDEMAAHAGVQALRPAFPAFDGGPGRLPFDDVARSFWAHHEKRLRVDGVQKPTWPGEALRKLREWMSRDYDASRKAFDAAQRSVAQATGAFVQAGSREAMIAAQASQAKSPRQVEVEHRAFVKYLEISDINGWPRMKRDAWMAAGMPAAAPPAGWVPPALAREPDEVSGELA